MLDFAVSVVIIWFIIHFFLCYVLGMALILIRYMVSFIEFPVLPWNSDFHWEVFT